MLFLLFQLGKDRYALEAELVAEVLPMVHLKQIPRAPAPVAGVFNLRGVPVPVIDLTMLALGQPSRARMSTRIVLVRHPDSKGTLRQLGLIAEKATETIRRDPADFVDAGVSSEGAPYLGPVAHYVHGLIQRVDVHKLLPSSVCDVLFMDHVAP